MRTNNFINWARVSEYLTGDISRISTSRIPKKYQKIVDKIEELNEQIIKILDNQNQ